ncbi:MAG TPA: PfkB family carbohydrate kinase, partial [Propionibacteriaceae bacterium]
GLSRIDASTSYTIVSQAPGRDRTFWHHLGANEFFDGRDLDLTGVDLVHIGYPNLMAQLYVDDGARLVDLFARAHELGCTTSVDLAVIDVHEPDRVARWTRFFDQILPHTDVISPSLEDLASVLDWPSEATPAAMAGAAQRLLAWGVGVVLITGGVHGLHVATADEARLSRTGALAPLLSGHGHTTYRQPALPVAHVAGTTGAGDVATAGFLSGLLSGVGPAGAAEWAARAAARHVSGDAYSTDRPEPFKDPEPSKDEETAR